MSSPSRSQQRQQAPMSAEQISRFAEQYEFNPLIPLRYWFRTAACLLKEASIYEREGNDQQAYLLLFRHAQLVLVHIAGHPSVREQSSRQSFAVAKRDVQANFPKLESLKTQINQRYDRHVKLMRERERRSTAVPVLKDEAAEPHISPRTDPALAGVAKPLNAAENKDLAVKLAKREFSRRAVARGSARHGEPLVDAADRKEVTTRPSEPDDLSRRMQELRSRVAPPRPASTPQGTGQKSLPFQMPDKRQQSTYKYPQVRPHNRPEIIQPSPVIKDEQRPPSPISPPALPAKVSVTTQPEVSGEPSPPPIPSKVPSAPPPRVDETSPSPGRETPSKDLSPSTFTFVPSAYLESGTPLRTIFIAPEVRQHFLSIAEPNTRRNLETCGILCGTLLSNAFFVSRLLIPEQESTSDTCEMVNEGAIFDYCDSEDLMVLGWIHTHPTQTCFMSSRDLHTQSGYQVMLPESIAIVCAPSKDPDWGVFRLTDPPGLKTVLSCTQSGIFHPHAESNVYTDALRPGHVFEATGLEYETVDLRSGKPKILPRPF